MHILHLLYMKRQFVLQKITVALAVAFIFSSFQAAIGQVLTTYPDVEHVNGFKCCSDHLLHAEELAPKQRANDVLWQSFMRSGAASAGSRATYTIPVVFHIIHDGGIENISDNDVLTALGHLNDGFEHAGYYTHGTGFNADIAFCLAKQDPQGNATTGINRVQSVLTNMDANTDDQAVKDLIRWDPTSYVNIWLVKEICRGTECGVAGYAYFPSAHGQDYDGILVESGFMISGGQGVSVLIHEMGHYLGLYHTFEGGCANMDCTADGDQVCDTPPDASTARPPCYAPANSCSTDEDDTSANNPFRSVANGGIGDQVDMHENFMDYSDLACYSGFTEGQAQRMEFFLTSVRQSLLQSIACDDPCPNPVSVNINNADQNIDVGTVINFDGQVVNTSSLEWRVNNSIEGGSEDLMYQFDQEGTFVIILTGYSDDPLCMEMHDTVTVRVTCPVTASFTPTLEGCYGLDTTIRFTNTSMGHSSIEWILNDTVRGATDVVNLMMQFPGRNKLELVATNGACTDTLVEFFNISCNEICDNGYDDDGDGFVDYYDPDCCGTNEHFNFICDEPCAEPQPFNYDVGLEWRSTISSTGLFLPVAGDIDADGVVEIVVVYNSDRDIAILDGRDGSLERIIVDPNGEPTWSLALADINNDGFGEIISSRRSGELIAFDYQGNLLFESAQRVSYYNTGGVFGKNYDMYIEVADFNQDGNPEIYVGNRIFNGQTGQLIVGGGANNNYGLGQNDFQFDDNWQKYLTVAIDILPDNACPDCQGLELVAGNQIYSVDIATATMQVVMELPGQTDGFTYVADYDQDGDLDIVVLANDRFPPSFNSYHHLFVWDGQTTTLIGEWTLMELLNNQVGGLVLGNLDNDSELEVSFKIGRYLYALDNDLSLMWIDEVVDGSAAQPLGFDFNYDGILEVVYRDDLFLGIYEGATGDTLYIQEARSATVADAIGICDLDGDGSAEIFMDAINGVRSYGILSGQKWADARPVFNQPHFYNIHINDDLSVPAEQQDPTIVYDRKIINNSNTAMTIPQPSEDGNLVIDTIYCDGNMTTLAFTVCNTGLVDIPATFPYTIYCGSPEEPGAVVMQSNRVNVTIQPDECRQFTFSTANNSCNGQYFILLNDDSSIAPPFDIADVMPIGAFAECNYLNNVDSVSFEVEELIVEIAGDTAICNGQSTMLYSTYSHDNYLWSTNETDSTIEVNTEGWYWLEVEGECGIIERDSIYVLSLPNNIPPVDLGNDTVICTSGIVVLDASVGPYTYRWNTGETNSRITIWDTGTYRVTVSDDCGNEVVDEININYADLVRLIIGVDTAICLGDSIVLTMPGPGSYSWGPSTQISCIDCDTVVVFPMQTTTYYGVFADENGCVLIDSVLIEIDTARMVSDTVALCPGDSILFGNDWIDTVGSYSFLQPSPGCDTLFSLMVMADQGFVVDDTIQLCVGDTAFFDGRPLTAPGQLTYRATSLTTCDTLVTITALEVDTILIEQQVALCFGDSVLVANTFYFQDTILKFEDMTANGCDSITTVTVSLSRGSVTFPEGVSIRAGEEINLAIVPNQTLISTIRWNPGDFLSCDTCAAVTASPQNSTIYTIRVVDTSGCIHVEDVNILVLASTSFYIPTAFSPNGDGINDRFLVFGPLGDNSTYTVKVFNRWGGKVFERLNADINEHAMGWDGTANGKQLNPGTYIYQLTVTSGNVVQEFSGEIQLVR